MKDSAFHEQPKLQVTLSSFERRSESTYFTHGQGAEIKARPQE